MAEGRSGAGEARARATGEEAFGPTEITSRYGGGLEDYVRHINAKKTPIHRSIVGFGAEGTGKNDMRMSVEVAMQWSDAYSESVYSFANTINTHEGGTHEEDRKSVV